MPSRFYAAYKQLTTSKKNPLIITVNYITPLSKKEQAQYVAKSFRYEGLLEYADKYMPFCVVADPTIGKSDVLYGIAAEAYDGLLTFHGFCNRHGVDGVIAERLYAECVDLKDRFFEFLGEDVARKLIAKC